MFFTRCRGLKINDDVIGEGQSVLAKWAYDSATDSGRADVEGIPGVTSRFQIHGSSLKIDQLGDPVFSAIAPGVERCGQ
jgi:hypothetical protein